MSLRANAEALEEYEKQQKLGKKEKGELLALDELLESNNITTVGEVSLGIVQIPIDLIVGTKNRGRSSAFSQSFHPILPEESEFAHKWVELYKAQMDEGIRDPIKVYEFMNKFYVEEGNKRVSVMKCVGAVAVPGYVTRILPAASRKKEVRIYYEFVAFYRLAQLYEISFSELGSYAKLQHLVGKKPDEKWTDKDRSVFKSVQWRFKTIYEELEKTNETGTADDALLNFMSLYDYSELVNLSIGELKEKILKSRQELKVQEGNVPELHMSPEENVTSKKKGLFSLFSSGTSNSNQKIQVAFIHAQTPESSSWTYGHELGRKHLDQVFNDKLVTMSYTDATEDSIEEIIEKSIADGNNLIFTTSAQLLKGSLKAAIDHPEVKILNCSLNTSHKYIRTYYARMYEAKFLMGAIAGTVADDNKIGYLADYPIYGTIAQINAFALGAKMVNPRAKIYLEWTKIKDHDPFERFHNEGITCISGRDMITPKEASRHFGLYYEEGDYPVNIAMPVWHWGNFYEKLIRKLMKGSWKDDEISDATRGLNYWWGMSSGAIDVICSDHLPIGTARLIELLKKTIMSGDFNPFEGILYSQKGLVHKKEDGAMTPEEIVTMDWLAENVIGYIPQMDELIDQAKPVMSTQGLGGSI